MPQEIKVSEMDRVKADAKTQGWSFESELAERLYRGIAGFSGEFKTHDEIRNFIAEALSAERKATLEQCIAIAHEWHSNKNINDSAKEMAEVIERDLQRFKERV